MADAGDAPAPLVTYNLNPNKLPVFTGDPAKDGLSAEQFVEAIERVRVANRYDDQSLRAIFLSCLKGAAADWVDGTIANWMQDTTLYDPHLKRLFLRDFRHHTTSITAIALLEGLKQKPTEDTLLFFVRVRKAFNDMRTLKPQFEGPVWTAATSSAGFMGLPDVAKTNIVNTAREHFGVRNDDFFILQFFLNGVRNEIRQRLADIAPATGWPSAHDCYDKARDIEMNLGKATAADKVMAVDHQTSQPPQDEHREYVDAFGNQRGGRGRGRSSGRGHATSTRGSGATRGRGQAPNRYFQGNCHNCGKYGHRKTDCRSPPKVGNVDPAANNNSNSSDQQYEQQQQQPYQQQQYDEQQQYHYSHHAPAVETVGFNAFQHDSHLN